MTDLYSLSWMFTCDRRLLAVRRTWAARMLAVAVPVRMPPSLQCTRIGCWAQEASQEAHFRRQEVNIASQQKLRDCCIMGKLKEFNQAFHKFGQRVLILSSASCSFVKFHWDGGEHPLSKSSAQSSTVCVPELLKGRCSPPLQWNWTRRSKIKDSSWFLKPVKNWW